MSWLSHLLKSLRPNQAAAFQPHPSRWVVVDVEASGLDLRRNRLLSIAALALQASGAQPPRIVLGDSFEVVLQQSESDTALAQMSKENILVHGIGLGAQRQGTPAPQALRAFVDFVADSPLIAFHSFFDQTLIERSLRQSLQQQLPNPWVDVEHLGAVLSNNPRRHSLDEWMARYGIHCIARHQASADTLATAELLVRLWPQLVARQATQWPALVNLADNARYLPGRS
jgi:DNA polymerase-3 subunit epsilon